MSRHNSSRRRQYGRRQHEVRERRRTDAWRLDPADDLDTTDSPSPRNPGPRVFGFMKGGLTLEGNG